MSRTAVLEVLYADNHLLVVAKPAGVATVPDASGDASLLDVAKRWVEREKQKPGEAYLGVVQRLDRPVSGVVCFARTSKAADRLTAQLRERTAEKRYLAVARGWPAGEAGRVAHWLRKDTERNR
ncbi:MAG TPA: RNA pseudouridine synthase, partial [Planctomycetota bacterium]|nr:RNA pseudouridine synthase [Planctomycetota bacterium]